MLSERSGELVIRPFAQGDQVAARTLIQEGLGEHFGFVDETCNPDLDDIMASYVRAGHHFVVAIRGELLVGTGALRLDRAGNGHLVRMSVGRLSRRLGVGRALVTHLLHCARMLDLQRIEVETNNDWYDAIGLYERCGFREFSRDEMSVYLELLL